MSFDWSTMDSDIDVLATMYTNVHLIDAQLYDPMTEAPVNPIVMKKRRTCLIDLDRTVDFIDLTKTVDFIDLTNEDE